MPIADKIEIHKVWLCQHFQVITKCIYFEQTEKCLVDRQNQLLAPHQQAALDSTTQQRPAHLVSGIFLAKQNTRRAELNKLIIIVGKPATTGFGQPSAFGQQSNMFGTTFGGNQPAFGAAPTQQSGFGG